MDWFDVIGGDNPIKEYKKMQEQRQAQAWFVHGDGGPGPTETDGKVVREGAPFHAPPSMAGPGSGEASKPAVTATGRPQSPQSKPQVVLSAVRPRAVSRRPRKNRG